jgi:stage IV sporulation protein B
MIYRMIDGDFRAKFERALCFLLTFILALGTFFGIYGFAIPKTVSCFSDEEIPSYLFASFEGSGETDSNGVVSLTKGQYKLFGAIPVRSVTVAKLEDVKVYAGGVPFGIKFSTKGAVVIGFEDEAKNPAYKAGLRLHDTITKVNGQEISSAAQLSTVVETREDIELTYVRAGKENKVKFKAKYSESEEKYTLGIWLKDSGAGIGTLTYVMNDGSFGGLGHGICENETGELTPILNGSVLGVTINGLAKGQRGVPGELKGYFNSSKTGTIYKNTEVGVFGALIDIPSEIKGKSYSLGLKDEIKEGKAKVICTLDDNVRREYDVEICAINRNAQGNKCFTVKITDENLLAKTGGIVQGMSGSPIIQNGKLVGAITHVLVNDPTTGYGIFIENMIAQMGCESTLAKAS